MNRNFAHGLDRTPLVSRRAALYGGGAGLLATVTGRGRVQAAASAGPERIFDLRGIISSPVTIKSLDLLRVSDDFVVRATSTDGATGHAITNQHAPFLGPMFKQRVIPSFVGRDARDVEALIDDVHVWERNYKLAGVALWSCVSWAELAVLDLLGILAGKTVGELLGGKPLRTRVPMYISSTARDTTVEQEVAAFEEALAKTGARAVKYKVGGRMSNNADAAPGRTEALIALMRKRLGNRITLYADANGSFDARRGIEVGRMLEAHGVSIYEEPCPFEDLEETKRVTRALKKIVVAGGEQDHSWYRFRDIVNNHVLDMVQPDVSYNGGLVRTTRVARLAARARLPISPHCPQASTMIYTLALASYTPNLGAFQEYHLRLVDSRPWYAPDLSLVDGTVAIPTRPGLGWELDPKRMQQAKPV